MDGNANQKITIVGAGLGGAYLAVLLAKRGFNVTVYERLSKKEIIEDASKRSYNIILYGYAIDILKKAGIWAAVYPYLFSLKGTITHIPHATPIKTVSDQKKMQYLTINRFILARIFLQEAVKHPKVSIHYDAPVLSVNRHDKTITIQKENNKIETVSTNIIIGADGINSTVRIFLQQGQETTHIQEFSSFCYKQIMLSESLVNKLCLEKQVEHTWTQKNTFITSHFDKENNLSALLVYPKTTNGSDSLSSETEIETFIHENYPDLLPVLPEITEMLMKNPVGNFATIHTDPWYYKDFMVLIGDAAHGFYPFFGQGTSAAMGDAMILAELIDKYTNNWETIFNSYQQLRKRHMDTMGDLSKEVMKKYFRYQKADYTAVYDKVEASLNAFFPKLFNPPLFFSLVTDPEHADNHWQKYKKQRKMEKSIGLGLAVSALRGLAAIIEKSKKHKK